ncbi:MAG: PTS sugar transporter subunit IIA [Treponema sp.]|jgi:PTS system nitrogen regulatory IIA component|nr:PTS sugar transporter subunit IIA [Treponema sp.]
MTKTDIDVPLSTLVDRGDIFYNLSGTTAEAVITELIRLVKLRFSGFKEDLLKAVLEREALMPTGIGHGIALPHPRNPLVTDTEQQFVAIGFPATPVDWQALDGKLVHTAMLVVSASAKLHLHTLSKINFICQDDSFLSLLKAHASREWIISAIREAELSWK